MQDKDIIALFWRRDEAAVRETSIKYGKYCHRVAMNVLGNAEDSDECVNDTWLKAWNAIPPNRPGHFQGFLAKITRNLALDRWKRQAAARRGGGAVMSVLDELEECVSGLSDVERDYEAKELFHAMDAFINLLPEKERRIFVQRYFYMESVRDIADAAHLKSNHVSVILSRTRMKLRQYLQEQGFEV